MSCCRPWEGHTSAGHTRWTRLRTSARPGPSRSARRRRSRRGRAPRTPAPPGPRPPTRPGRPAVPIGGETSWHRLRGGSWRRRVREIRAALLPPGYKSRRTGACHPIDGRGGTGTNLRPGPATDRMPGRDQGCSGPEYRRNLELCAAGQLAVVPVPSPLEGVAVHVVQHPRIRRVAADRARPRCTACPGSSLVD